MKRRRSLKISSINLEPTQWQNDALHILSSAHDYRSMNEFLIKKVKHKHTHRLTGTKGSKGSLAPVKSDIHLKIYFQISDLESEDGKNDTMVDVVFKKALKEFRINIFNSYSTALAVSPFTHASLSHLGVFFATSTVGVFFCLLEIFSEPLCDL